MWILRSDTSYKRVGARVARLTVIRVVQALRRLSCASARLWRSYAVLASLGILAACGGTSPASIPPPVTISDLSAYLVTSRCADGMLAVLETNCIATPQTASDPMLLRRHDASGHTDGQIEDAFTENGYYTNTFGYPPNGPFVAAHGDGGDVLIIENGVARIDYTQNGTSGGGTVFGYWVGAACPGSTGWVVADDHAPTGSWESAVARLGAAPAPNDCPALNHAFTRWRLETIPVPLSFDGQPSPVVLPAIISEHYAGVSIATATSMERTISAKGIGRVLWQAWATTPSNVSFTDSGMAPWSSAPASGWYLHDERLLTDVEPGNGLTGVGFNWPSAGFIP